MLEALGVFSCKSFFESLMNQYSCPTFAPALMIWKAKMPIKIQVFAWTVAHGELNTCDMLQKRPRSCFSPQWCVMCKVDFESIDHLFLHCSVALAMW